MKVCLEVDVEGTQHFAARRLLQCAKRLRPGRRALHSLPVLQRQPRLAMVARDLSQRRVRVDLRPRLEYVAQHASAAGAARGAVALRVVGQTLMCRVACQPMMKEKSVSTKRAKFELPR